MTKKQEVPSFETNTTNSYRYIITLRASPMDFSSMHVPEINAGQPYIAKHTPKVSETIYVLNCLSSARAQLKNFNFRFFSRSQLFGETDFKTRLN